MSVFLSGASRESLMVSARRKGWLPHVVGAAILAISIALFVPGVASALPPGSQYPDSWEATSGNTADGLAPDGFGGNFLPDGVTATLNPPSSGTVTWGRVPGLPSYILGGVGSLILNGSNPPFFPSTTEQALQVAISGCSAAPCGSITYTFPQPVMTPSLLVGDVGEQTIWVQPEDSGIATYHDSPISVAGGGTFTLDSAGSQTPNMSIQSGGTVVGINDPGAYIDQPWSPSPPSCGRAPQSGDGYGCGAYDLQLPVAETRSVTVETLSQLKQDMALAKRCAASPQSCSE